MDNFKINIPSFPLPDMSLDSIGNNIIEVIAHVVDVVFSIVRGVASALVSFYDILLNINTYVLQLSESCSNQNVNGLPLIDIIGLYRFIVTDPIFLMTYMMVLMGCFFTIYKLVILLIKMYTMIKDGVSVGKNTKVSFLEYLQRKIFK